MRGPFCLYGWWDSGGGGEGVGGFAGFDFGGHPGPGVDALFGEDGCADDADVSGFAVAKVGVGAADGGELEAGDGIGAGAPAMDFEGCAGGDDVAAFGEGGGFAVDDIEAVDAEDDFEAGFGAVFEEDGVGCALFADEEATAAALIDGGAAEAGFDAPFDEAAGDLLGGVGAVFVAGHGIDAATVVIVDEAGAGWGFGAADEGFAGPWGAEGGSEAGGEAGAFFGGFGGGAGFGDGRFRGGAVAGPRFCGRIGCGGIVAAGGWGAAGEVEGDGEAEEGEGGENPFGCGSECGGWAHSAAKAAFRNGGVNV